MYSLVEGHNWFLNQFVEFLADLSLSYLSRQKPVKTSHHLRSSVLDHRLCMKHEKAYLNIVHYPSAILAEISEGGEKYHLISLTFNLLKISWGALFEQRQLLCAGRCQCRTWWSATAWCPTATQSSSPPWTAPYSPSIRSSSFFKIAVIIKACFSPLMCLISWQ